MPVLFYIHGGSYYEGGASWLRPDILLEEDIIVVTIQYRLGLFGFLSLNQSEYSGNMGLKDQLLALQWVNDNIHNFGGDKRNITLSGYSAGASSVNLHTLLPQSRGLFQRAIMSGGAVYNPFAYIGDSSEQTAYLSNKLSAKLGAAGDVIDQNKILQWLKDANAVDIAAEMFLPLYTPGQRNKRLTPIWVPVVERKLLQYVKIVCWFI